MTRILSHRVVPELAALWLAELLVLFVVLHALQSAWLWPGTRPPVEAGEYLYRWGESVNLAAVIASIMGVTALSVGLYRVDMCLDHRRFLTAALLATGIGGAVVCAIGPMLGSTKPLPPGYLLTAPVLWLASLFIFRLAFGALLRRRLFGRRIVVVGQGPRALNLASAIDGHRGGLFTVVPQEQEQNGALSPSRLQSQRIWAVVVAEDSPAKLTIQVIQTCQRAGIRVYDDSVFWEQELGRVDLNQADPAWFDLTNTRWANGLGEALRRGTDIGIALGLLIFTLPVMALTALAIRLDSRGPIFYRQTRLGLHGRHFTLLKFRSMREDAESGGKPVWASEDDPRVTRIGGVIRRARIDELPQLFNVLRGEMAIVGPRPERPEFVAELAAIMPLYNQRQKVKPGITGWAQVSFPYGASVEDARQKLSYDLYYIKYRSLLLDLLILMATVRVILFREGSR